VCGKKGFGMDDGKKGELLPSFEVDKFFQFSILFEVDPFVLVHLDPDRLLIRIDFLNLSPTLIIGLQIDCLNPILTNCPDSFVSAMMENVLSYVIIHE
jgi:hypothetical protein